MFQPFYRSKTLKRSWHGFVVLLVVAMFSAVTPGAPSLYPEGVATASGPSVGVPAPGRIHQALLETRHARSPRQPVVALAQITSAPAVASTVSMTTTYEPVPSPTADHVISLIKSIFPPSAWHDAEVVAWCESKFNPADMGFDSNGTHDRGVFQLNDGGTAQNLMGLIGQNPNDLNLAFNPVLNVRAAAVLYKRDGWGQWSCASVL